MFLSPPPLYKKQSRHSICSHLFIHFLNQITFLPYPISFTIPIIIIYSFSLSIFSSMTIYEYLKFHNLDWMVFLTFEVLYPFCDYSPDKNPLSKSYFLFLLSSIECFFQISSSLTFGAFSPQLQLFIVKTFRFNSMLLSSSHRSLLSQEKFSLLLLLFTLSLYTTKIKRKGKW